MDKITKNFCTDMFRRFSKRAAYFSLLYAAFAANSSAYASHFAKNLDSSYYSSVPNALRDNLERIDARDIGREQQVSSEDTSSNRIGNPPNAGYSNTFYKRWLVGSVVMIANLTKFTIRAFQKLILTPVIYLGKHVAQFVAQKAYSYVGRDIKLWNDERSKEVGNGFTSVTEIIPSEVLNDWGGNTAGQPNIIGDDLNSVLNNDKILAEQRALAMKEKGGRARLSPKCMDMANIKISTPAGYQKSFGDVKSVRYNDLDSFVYKHPKDLVIGIDIGSEKTKLAYYKPGDKICMQETPLAKRFLLSSECSDQEASLLTSTGGSMEARLAYSPSIDGNFLKDGILSAKSKAANNAKYHGYKYVKSTAKKGMHTVFDIGKIREGDDGLAQKMGYLVYASRLYKQFALSGLLEPSPEKKDSEGQEKIICLSIPDSTPADVRDSLLGAIQIVFECNNDLEKIKNYISKPGKMKYKYQVISNSMAACMTFQYENDSKTQNETLENVMVDIGYNNTTISAVSMDRGRGGSGKLIKPVTVSGLGGGLVNELLYKYIEQKIKDLEPGIKVDSKAQVKIMKAINTAKEKLSASGASTVEIKVDCILDEGEDFECIFSVPELNKILTDNGFIEQLEKTCREYFSKLKDSGIVNAPAIVILGGTARIPYIKDVLIKLQNEFFDSGALNQTVNMDEFGACGAAYAAASDRAYVCKDCRKSIENDVVRELVKLKCVAEMSNGCAKFRNDLEALCYAYQQAKENYQNAKKEDKVKVELIQYSEVDGLFDRLFGIIKGELGKAKSAQDIEKGLKDIEDKLNNANVMSKVLEYKNFAEQNNLTDLGSTLDYILEGVHNDIKKIRNLTKPLLKKQG